MNKEILFLINELNINVNISYTNKFTKDYGEEALDLKEMIYRTQKIIVILNINKHF